MNVLSYQTIESLNNVQIQIRNLRFNKEEDDIIIKNATSDGNSSIAWLKDIVNVCK